MPTNEIPPLYYTTPELGSDGKLGIDLSMTSVIAAKRKLKASREKKRYKNLPKEVKNNVREKKRLYEKEKRDSLRSDPVRKKQYNDKYAGYKARSRDYIRDRESLIKLYPHDEGKFPPNIGAVKRNYDNGYAGRSSKCAIPRIKKIDKAHGLIVPNLGQVEREDVNCRLTDDSLIEISSIIHQLLGGTLEAGYAVGIDLGSGTDRPNIIFSQARQPRGCLFGVEVNMDTVMTVNHNLATITEMAVVNHDYFSEDNVREHGELDHVRPPHILNFQGDALSMEHYNGVDVIYCYDAANGEESVCKIIAALNHERSQNVKVFMVNMNPAEMEEYGAVNFRLISKMTGEFHATDVTREFYFYARECFVKYDGRKRGDDKFKTVINPLKLEHFIDHDIPNDIDPLLQKMYQIYVDGRERAVNNINLDILVNHNIKYCAFPSEASVTPKLPLSDAMSRGDAIDANTKEIGIRINKFEQSKETATSEQDAGREMVESLETEKDSSGFVFNEEGIAANIMAFLNFEELQYLLCTHRMFSTDCKWKVLCTKHHNLEQIPPEYEGVAWYKVYWNLVENKGVQAQKSDDLLEWAEKVLKSTTTKPVMKLISKVSRAQKEFDFDINHVMKVDAGQGFTLNKTLLVMAVLYDRGYVVEWLVNEMTASVNSCVADQESSPLIYAARQGNLDVVKCLLNNGADFKKTASYGYMKDDATGRLCLSRSIHEALDAEEWARENYHHDVANFIQNKKVEYENKILKEENKQLRAALKNK